MTKVAFKALCRRCKQSLPIPGKFLCVDCFGKCTACGGEAVRMPSGYYRAFCSRCRTAAETKEFCSACSKPRDGTHPTYCRSCYQIYDRGRTKGQRCSVCGGGMNAKPSETPVCRRCAPVDTPASAKEKSRLRWLKKAYGLTPERWQEIFDSQGRCCAVCRATEAGGNGVFSVDHNHETGAIRGIVCNPCNITLGASKENVERLRQLIEYLARCG